MCCQGHIQADFRRTSSQLLGQKALILALKMRRLAVHLSARLTFFELAPNFDALHGIDVSPRSVEYAKKYNNKRWNMLYIPAASFLMKIRALM